MQLIEKEPPHANIIVPLANEKLRKKVLQLRMQRCSINVQGCCNQRKSLLVAEPSANTTYAILVASCTLAQVLKPEKAAKKKQMRVGVEKVIKAMRKKQKG